MIVAKVNVALRRARRTCREGMHVEHVNDCSNGRTVLHGIFVHGRILEALEALEQSCSKGSLELAAQRQQNHIFIIT